MSRLGDERWEYLMTFSESFDRIADGRRRRHLHRAHDTSTGHVHGTRPRRVHRVNAFRPGGEPGNTCRFSLPPRSLLSALGDRSSGPRPQRTTCLRSPHASICAQVQRHALPRLVELAAVRAARRGARREGGVMSSAKDAAQHTPRPHCPKARAEMEALLRARRAVRRSSEAAEQAARLSAGAAERRASEIVRSVPHSPLLRLELEDARAPRRLRSHPRVL